MRRDFWVLSWSDFHRSFGNEWCCSVYCLISLHAVFDRFNVLSSFEFDTVRFITFSSRILMNRFYGMGTIVLSLNSETPSSKFLLELIVVLLCRFWILRRVARSRLLRWSNGFSTTLLAFCHSFKGFGLLEYWIRSHVWGHWFGCSLRPGAPLNSPWKLAASFLSC